MTNSKYNHKEMQINRLRYTIVAKFHNESSYQSNTHALISQFILRNNVMIAERLSQHFNRKVLDLISATTMYHIQITKSKCLAATRRVCRIRSEYFCIKFIAQ